MSLRLLHFYRWKGTTTFRVVATVLLLTITLAISGVPQPVRKQLKPGERFPCETCACGCSSAAFCWDQCCCHSDEEKLTWAHEQGVKPPDFLVARVALGTKNSAKSTAAASCCRLSTAKPQVADCCQQSNSPDCASCVNASSCGSQDEEQVEQSIRLLSFRAYAKCRGMNWVWTLLNQVHQKHRDPVKDNQREAIVIAWFTINNDPASGLSLTPDPPVPWHVAS